MYSKTIEINTCDEYDQKEHKAHYYISTSRKSPVIYTNNPIKEIHERLPETVMIDTYKFKPEMLGLYINCLVAEGYQVFYKVSKDEDGYSVWGHTVYLKISKEEQEKLKKKLLKENKKRNE